MAAIVTLEEIFQSTLPARGATINGIVNITHAVFQSTLPARGATHCPWCGHMMRKNFNPRSPHGERLSLDITNGSRDYFNPRSPHGERLRLARCW